MGFLSPVAFLFFGLIAILIIFYLFKKRFERKIVSSTYLWDQLMKEWETNRWNKKLNQNLLFFLQLLILIALIIALARPYFVGENTITSEQIVIIIDTSASMAAEEKDGTRFQLAKEEATKLVKQLHDEQVVTIINGKNNPELLLINETNSSKLLQQIEELPLSYGAGNMEDSLKLADSMINKDSSEIHLFSDHVEHQAFDTLNLNTMLTVHNIGTTSENISIRSFGVKQVDEQVDGIVTIFNEKDVEETIKLQIVSENKTLKEIEKVIPPAELTVIEISNLPVETVYEANLLTSDIYPLDNQSYAFLATNESPKIYTAGDSNPFLLKALQSLSTEMITIRGKSGESLDFPKETTGGISVLSNIPASNWPKGAKLIISPVENGPFEIKEKRNLEFALSDHNDPLVSYVETESLYLSKSYPIGNLQDLEPVVMSGEDVVIAKGRYNGDPIVLLSLDIEDSDWPLHPYFPVLINNILDFLQPPTTYLGRFSPGEMVEVSYTPTTTSAYLEDTDGLGHQDVNTNELLTVPTFPGLYQLYEQTEFGLQGRYFAIEIADGEKTSHSEESFVINEHEDVRGTDGSVMNELWPWIALAVFILLFVEWEVYRRGIRGR